MTRRGTAIGALLALILAFGAGIWVGAGEIRSSLVQAATNTASITLTTLGNDRAPSNVDAAQLWRAWHLLEENYIQTHASSATPTAEERLWGAIEGLTESYKDPYTVFMPPQEAKMFKEEISGAFEGVGMELGQKDGKLIVIAPLKDSPAYRAGIKSGDFVAAIDGKPTEGAAVEDAVKRIRGPKGTTIKLTIVREGESAPQEISIVRDTISIPVLKHEKREDGIYVIELYSFSANSRELFRQALRAFLESGSNKLLLDLRGNPGGYLEASVDMASYFLPVGATVVTEDFKGNQTNKVHRSLGYNVFANRNLSMAILVDQGSASASEILAGALKEHGIAKVIGTRTFGKGSVQELLELGNGAQLKVTIARWLTPKGTSISEGGLMPDITVERTAEDVKAAKDPQKDAAITYLKGQ
jgi:carboxyl-terminal processing protease